MKKTFILLFFVMLSALALTPLSASAASDEPVSIVGWFNIGGGLDCSALAGSSATSSSFNTDCGDDPNADGMFSAIACKVMKSFNNASVPLYCGIVTNSGYLAMVNAAMLLYVVLAAVFFVSGITPMKTSELMKKLIKVTIIYAFLVDADVYYNYIYTTVLSLPQDIVKVIINSPVAVGESGSGSSNFFQYVDQGVTQVITQTYNEITGHGATYGQSNLKIFLMGIALWQTGGDMVGGLFFTVVTGWIVSYFSIMIRYLLAMLAMMFLLMLGPLFLPTMLFRKTEYLAEEWMFMLITFILQITLVVTFLIMIQPFYKEFYDSIKYGLTSSSPPSQSSQNNLVPFGDDSIRVEKDYGYNGITPAQGQAFVSKSGKSIPETVFELLKMFAIMLLSYQFAQHVPQLAGLLTGRARNAQLFQGVGGKGPVAQLFGQGGAAHHSELSASGALKGLLQPRG